MKNRVTRPNPYGKIDLDKLSSLERRAGSSLPKDYGDYLCRFNGGGYEKDVVRISDRQGETRVHHWYGIHSGPEYLRLLESQDAIESLQGKYLTICDDASGNPFLIKINGESKGAIYFLDHEVPISETGLVCVANSFSDFVNKMKSGEESMDEFKSRDPVGYSDYQRRLEEAKREHAEWVKNKDKAEK